MWWSRLAPPHLHAWTDSAPLRLVPHVAATHAPAPHALAGDGWWRADPQARLLRWVEERPGSQVTTPLLRWLAARVADDGHPARGGLWAHASWPVSRAVRTWLQAHHPRGTRAGGGRLVLGPWPRQSPGRQRLAPPGVPGTRAVAEPTRTRTGQDTRPRLCADDHGELFAPLAHKVA